MNFKNSIPVIAVLLLSSIAFAQPANDNCSGAISLGTLPTPGACTAGLQNGTATTLTNQTTAAATASSPYVYQTACTSGTMTPFALDTWYSFTASGTIGNVNISGFPNANIAVWSGTCGNLLGRGCTVANAAGNATLVVTQLTIGQTYYIQVSGNTTTATDPSFTLAVDNDIDCNDCLLNASLTATPAPVNGGYSPGQVVQFCYTITGWSQQNTNWLHGVQITMGAGWTGAITGTVPAATQQTFGGAWYYYNSSPGTVNGTAWGKGFYFDADGTGVNPMDNFGDDCDGAACTWTFCWNQTVSSTCTPGANLSTTVNTSGDGESGSWTSSACVDDNATVFNAVQVCCTAPTMSAVPVTCIGGTNGSVTATHGTGSSPWDYVWTNSSGTVVGTTMNSTAASNTVTNLPAGTYTVTVTDNVNCVTTNTVVVGPGVSCTCLINNFTANIGACQPNNTFPVSGTVQYSNAPATGTLVVEVTNASGTYTQTFNPPFVNGTTYNYNITNAISDGSAATVEVYFTADLACTQIINFTSPAACGCAAEIGTYTADIIGVSNNNYVLCYGDVIDIQTNNDWTDPAIANSPPGPIYDPGVSWLIYSCPPSIGLVPTALQDVSDDPCLLGIVSDFDLNDVNDQAMINAFPAGTFTNNTIYYVPITMYSIATGTYSYVNTSVPCYDLGTPYAVQYLPQILSPFTQTCTSVTATISGGLPAVNGSQFSVVAGSLTPANASFGNTTCSNGGTIVINGLTTGQAFSFQVQDANGCPKTVSGTFVGPPTLSYPQAAYCKNASNPSPTITGPTGGTYSSTAGLSINASTGVINIASSTAGTYTVTYTSPAVPGPSCTATFVITINPLPVIAVPDQTVCAGTAVTLNGNGADTYTWTGGITNGVAFTPATTTTYTVTGTITATGCTNTDVATVTVNPLPTVNAGVDQTVCAGTAVTLSGSGAATYTWNNGVTNGVAFTPAATTTYTVTGTSAAGCTNTDQVVVTVNPIPVVNAGPDVSICTGGSTNLTASGATTYSWAPGGQTTATITVTPAATTTYTVTGTSLGCTATDAVTVTILANAPINAGPDVAICAGASTTLIATGGVTYSWNNGLGVGNNFSVSPAVTTTYTVVGTNAAGCTGTDAITVTVNPLPTVNAGTDQTVCAGTAVTLSGSGATTYTWNNGVTNGVAFTPAATTTYTVTGTSAAGCINTDQVIVTVNPLPTVNAGVDQTVCAGTAVTLNGSGAATYTWNNGVTNGVAFTPAATTTYTVTGTSAAGCINTDQVVVTVNPLPTVNAGADQTVCLGATVTLSGSGAATYTWNNGITNGVAFTPTLGTTTYTVTGTSAAGCINTDQVIVTVNPLPAPVINGPATYCAGNTALLSTSTPFTTYNWSTGSTNPTINATAANNPITVTVTNAFGCQATSPVFTVTQNNVITANFNVTICQGQSATIHGVPQTVAGVYSQTFTLGTGCDSTSNVTLIVNPLPAVNAGVDQAVCTGTATTLTATGATTYSWNNGVTNGIPFTQAIGATTYTVTGTSAAGCTNTDQVVITVNPLPVVGAGPDQTVCAGTAVTLTGSGATTYTWNNGVTNAVAFTPVATNTYTVTGTDANGCINTDQVLVTVNPIPTVGAGADQTICVGASVTLSGSGAATYTWDNGVTNAISFAPTATTTYTVTGTSAAGCTSTDQVVVTVNPLPVVNAGVDQTICIGASVTLAGSGAATYTWNNGVTDGAAFAPAATTTYSVTGTSAAGCVNTDQVTVTVNPLPTVNAGADQTVCAGTAVTLTASGAATYTWNNGVTDGTPFTPAATTTYTVTGTSAAGCVNTDQVTVTVNPIPTVFAGNDISICAGQTVTLSGSGAATYTWDNGATNGVAFTPVVGTTTYTVTGTSAAGCINTDQVIVTVNPIPVVTFSPDVTQGCAPLTVNFTNNTPNVSNCVWTMSDGSVINGCGTVTNTFTTPGCYDVTLTTTSNTGCVNSSTIPNLICVEGAPLASFIPSNSILTEFNPVVNFNNTTTGASNYLWNFGDNSTTSTLEDPSHNYSGNEVGNYLITLIAYSPLGCADTAYATIQIQEELIFYVPNTFTPDDDNYNQTFQPVFTSGFDPYDYTLLIFNRWGEIVFESHDANVGWDGSYGSNGEIEMVQDGTYTWKIEFKTNKNDERKMVVGHVNILK